MPNPSVIAESEQLSTAEQRSQFSQRLASDPALAERCAAVAAELQLQAAPDVAACERSGQLTGADLKVVINSRADDLSTAERYARDYQRHSVVAPPHNDMAALWQERCDLAARVQALAAERDSANRRAHGAELRLVEARATLDQVHAENVKLRRQLAEARQPRLLENIEPFDPVEGVKHKSFPRS